MCTHHNKEVINKLNITIFKSCWQNHLENKIQKLAFQGPVTKKVSPLNTLHWFSLLRAQQRRLLWCLGICTTFAFIWFNQKMVLLSKPMFPNVSKPMFPMFPNHQFFIQTTQCFLIYCYQLLMICVCFHRKSSFIQLLY